MHIVVIEEELPIRDIVQHALELGGHQVDVYPETPETLSSCDLVIIEPGEQGEAFPAIWRLTQRHHLPVLILTWHEWNIDLAQKLRIPIIRKIPFHLAQLLDMIDSISA
jgi:DNA-binding response OmpR family regulator